MSPRKKSYDIFLSYAHVDNADRQISRLSSAMSEIFHRRTGRKLKIFQDRPDIQTAETWQSKIEDALNSSSLLVPVISRAYLDSYWCLQEWYHFTARERGAVPVGQNLELIYPVLVDGMPGALNDSVAQSWLDDVSRRQAIDLGGSAPGSHQHDSEVQHLMDDIMAKIHWLNAQGLSAGQPTDRQHLIIYTGYVGQGERFINLLSEALSATIVGMTNTTLASALGQALEQKRQSSGRPDAFWQSLRIVFLSHQLLDSLNDVLADYPEKAEGILQRRLAAEYGRRSIRLLLEQVPKDYWELYESPYQIPFAGTLFEMPDRSRKVQLLMRRPKRRTPNQKYLEFDKPDQYISGAFEDAVQMSRPLRDIILFGWPRDNGTFQCTGKRFMEHVMRDDSHAAGWLPMVLIITWRTTDSDPELWMQLRTRRNSHREIGRLGHLNSYIFENDITTADEIAPSAKVNFDLPEAARVEAARRCYRADIGEYPQGNPAPVGMSEYLYLDKENLFCYLFTVELPRYPHFLREAEMRPVSVTSLLHIREMQALRAATRVCKARKRGEPMTNEAEIAALNLILHDQPDLAEQVLDSARNPTRLEAASDRIDELSQNTRRVRQADGELVQVLGTAGLQYRQFFTTFLSAYENLGLPGAAQILADVRADQAKNRALEQLARMYRDEDLMSTVSNFEQ